MVGVDRSWAWACAGQGGVGWHALRCLASALVLFPFWGVVPWQSQGEGGAGAGAAAAAAATPTTLEEACRVGDVAAVLAFLAAGAEVNVAEVRRLLRGGGPMVMLGDHRLGCID